VAIAAAGLAAAPGPAPKSQEALDLGREAPPQPFQAWAWNGASRGGLVTLPV